MLRNKSNLVALVIFFSLVLFLAITNHESISGMFFVDIVNSEDTTSTIINLGTPTNSVDNVVTSTLDSFLTNDFTINAVATSTGGSGGGSAGRSGYPIQQLSPEISAVEKRKSEIPDRDWTIPKQPELKEPTTIPKEDVTPTIPDSVKKESTEIVQEPVKSSLLSQVGLKLYDSWNWLGSKSSDLWAVSSKSIGNVFNAKLTLLNYDFSIQKALSTTLFGNLTLFGLFKILIITLVFIGIAFALIFLWFKMDGKKTKTSSSFSLAKFLYTII